MSAPLWRERPQRRDVDVLGIGQCSLDQVCTVEGLPRFAGKQTILAYETMPGGQVATAVLGAARLGLRARFVGAIGDEPGAERVLAPLEAAGVDVVKVRRVAGAPTRLAVILVDRASGERTVLGYRDPRLRLRLEDVSGAGVARARCLLLDAEDPEVAAEAARRARQAGVPVVLDADTVHPGIEALVAQIDFPVVSRHFAEGYGGDGRVRSGLARLLAQGARLAVATLGPLGCLARGPEGELASPGFSVAARDTTGAGDAFHAAFAWGLLAGLAPAPLLRTANAAAALACGAVGAQGGLPTQEVLEGFLRAHEPRAWEDPDAAPGRPDAAGPRAR